MPPVRGTRTIFPSDSASRELVLEKLTLAAQQHSFQQIITPVLEHTELFSRSLGTASDIVMKVCVLAARQFVRLIGMVGNVHFSG